MCYIAIDKEHTSGFMFFLKLFSVTQVSRINGNHFCKPKRRLKWCFAKLHHLKAYKECNFLAEDGIGCLRRRVPSALGLSILAENHPAQAWWKRYTADVHHMGDLKQSFYLKILTPKHSQSAFSPPPAIRLAQKYPPKMQFHSPNITKITIRYHLTPIRMAATIKTNIQTENDKVLAKIWKN